MPEELPTAADLPDAMTERDQWLCWRTQERNGKETKVPIDPSTGRFGSATDPELWTTFETAHERAASSDDGIGFAFSQDGPLAGVDLDDCRVPTSGTTLDWAEAIIESLDSYTEVSPSGTGYHVILEGTIPGDRSRRDDVEMYDQDRFFTVTGDHVEATPTAVHERQDALAAVYADHVAENDDGEASATGSELTDQDTSSTSSSDSSTANTASESASLSDEELLERARSAANGEKFRRLWRGNTAGYESHSEADMALCSLLAFWTGGDRDRVDDLFRESGLMREKWDETHYSDGSTYGEKTVERAVQGTNEVYDPSRRRAEHERAESAAAEDRPTTESKPEQLSTAAGSDAETRGTTDGDVSTDRPSTDSTDDLIAGTAPRSEVDLQTIERLQQQIERLHEEREDLRAALEAERARRRELERELDADQSDARDWRTRLQQLLTSSE